MRVRVKLAQAAQTLGVLQGGAKTLLQIRADGGRARQVRPVQKGNGPRPGSPHEPAPAGPPSPAFHPSRTSIRGWTQTSWRHNSPVGPGSLVVRRSSVFGAWTFSQTRTCSRCSIRPPWWTWRFEGHSIPVGRHRGRPLRRAGPPAPILGRGTDAPTRNSKAHRPPPPDKPRVHPGPPHQGPAADSPLGSPFIQPEYTAYTLPEHRFSAWRPVGDPA